MSISLPDVLVEALVALLEEDDFLYNDIPETSRMRAAKRLARAAMENSARHWLVVVNAFNR